ncbi:MAG TPA: hypothetical protein VK196_13915 [Magnetospirillum sp.]|nr:hypothetical protein [Magnetospirillum sp.]
MDDAEVVGRMEGYWVVVSRNRRYYLTDDQFLSAEGPRVGLKGRLGYVQRPTSKILMFTDHDARA